MDVEDSPPNLKLKRPIVGLVVGFGILHVATMILAIFPHSWGINQVLSPYRQLTSPQEWGMFHTIPTMQGNEITVEVVDGAGKVESVGPLLPGLKAYRVHSRIRNYYVLNQVTDPTTRYYDGYVEALGDALAERGVGAGSSFSVNLESDYVRLLKRIDEDGKMTLRKSEVRGPFAIGE